MTTLPSSVLFACSQNSVRSPMAEAMAKRLYGHSSYIDSVGVRALEVDNFAAAVLDEIGVDVHRHHAKTFDDVDPSSFDLIVTLSPEAHHKALELTRTIAADVEYWPTPDPTAIEGTREQRLSAYREVRDQLTERIKTRFGWQAGGNE
jgi:protein-tyrosine-phosphatase